MWPYLKLDVIKITISPNRGGLAYSYMLDKSLNIVIIDLTLDKLS
jgi:hypothetical protein